MQTGRKILNLRCDRKISQQDLARACNITPSALSKIEAGINSPRANVIWKIAKNLGVTIEYLLDEEMPYPYAGYSYRQGFLATNVDPNAMVRFDVTREEKAFLEALRKTSQVARDTALGIPEASVENLRLIHFIMNHARVQNPSQGFLKSFEALLTGGPASPAAAKPAAPAKPTAGVRSAPAPAPGAPKTGPRKRGRPRLAR